jgi:hypothetical protein
MRFSVRPGIIKVEPAADRLIENQVYDVKLSLKRRGIPPYPNRGKRL